MSFYPDHFRFAQRVRSVQYVNWDGNDSDIVQQTGKIYGFNILLRNDLVFLTEIGAIVGDALRVLL